MARTGPSTDDMYCGSALARTNGVKSGVTSDSTSRLHATWRHRDRYLWSTRSRLNTCWPLSVIATSYGTSAASA